MHWLLETQDRIATLTLNRAAAMNTLTPEALFELRDLCAQIEKDADIWAVVVQGDGANFSAGVDVSAIGAMIGQDEAAFAESLREMQNVLDVFQALPKPTIAKIRGYCVGGGVILAACCDFRLASTSARFSLPEVKRGIPVLMGTQRLVHVLGLARTKELTMLGEPISAAQAYDYGLLHRLCADEELDTATAALADQLRHLPPLTVRACKHIADHAPYISLRENQEMEIAAQAKLLHTADFKEAVNSFFEKRPPVFKGK